MDEIQHSLLDDIDPSADLYRRDRVYGFMDLRDDGNCLSTLTQGDPVKVNGLKFHTPEAVYQSLKFPNHIEFQKIISRQEYGMAAREKGEAIADIWRGYYLRPDWEEMKTAAMIYALATTLAARTQLGEELEGTEKRPIVMISNKDKFWGTKPDPDRICLIGRNVLGKILTEMREDIRADGGNAGETARRFSTQIPAGRLLINGRTVPPAKAR